MSTETENKVLEALGGIKGQIEEIKNDLYGVKERLSGVERQTLELKGEISGIKGEVSGIKKVQDIMLQRQDSDKKELLEMRKEDKKEILERIDRFESHTSKNFTIQRNILEIERNRVDKIYDSRDKVQMKFSKALVAGNGIFAGIVAFLVPAFK